MVLKDQCTDILPHYKDMNPGGVKEMTALDPELSAAPLAAKRKWCKKHRERLLKLQSRLQAMYSAQFQAMYLLQFYTLNIPLQINNCPFCAACFSDHESDATCIKATCTASSGISCCTEKQVNRGKMTDLQQFWEFCIQETWHSGKLLLQKEIVDAFAANEKKLGREIGSSHVACLQTRNNRTNQIVDVWIATCIRVASSDLWRGFGTAAKQTRQMDVYSDVGFKLV